MNRDVRSRLIRTLALLSCLVILSSCTIRSITKVEVSEDGSGKAAVTIAFDEEFRTLMAEDFGEEIDWDDPETYADLDLVETELGVEVDLERYAEGEFRGVVMSFEFGDLEELQSFLSGEMWAEDTGAAQLSINQSEEGRWEMRVGEDYMQSLREMGESEMLGIPASVMEDMFDINLEVTLPGEIVDHNGTVDGNTVRWQLKAGDTGQEAPFAVSEKSGMNLWLLLAAVVIIGAIVVAAVNGWRMGEPDVEYAIGLEPEGQESPETASTGASTDEWNGTYAWEDEGGALSGDQGGDVAWESDDSEE